MGITIHSVHRRSPWTCGTAWVKALLPVILVLLNFLTIFTNLLLKHGSVRTSSAMGSSLMIRFRFPLGRHHDERSISGGEGGGVQTLHHSLASAKRPGIHQFPRENYSHIWPVSFMCQLRHIFSFSDFSFDYLLMYAEVLFFEGSFEGFHD